MPVAPHPLDRIRVARPCRSEWSLMDGDERHRHCSNCSKDVYNVAGLTRDETMELLTSGGAVCLRLFRRPDGTILTADCAGGRAVAGRSRLRVVAVAAAAALSVAGLGAWATAEDEPICALPWDGSQAVMGEVALPVDWEAPEVVAAPEAAAPELSD